MNKQQLIRTLNFFVLIEKQQVELYKSQAEVVTDKKLARALKRFMEIEQSHVENITQLLQYLNSYDNPAFAVAGKAIGQGAKLIGTILAGTQKEKYMLTANIFGEMKAIQDYKKIIKQIDDPVIKEVLWNNLIDEELHLKWMKARIANSKTIYH